jgi:hypothetical protein
MCLYIIRARLWLDIATGFEVENGASLLVSVIEWVSVSKILPSKPSNEDARHR